MKMKFLALLLFVFTFTHHAHAQSYNEVCSGSSTMEYLASNGYLTCTTTQNITSIVFPSGTSGLSYGSYFVLYIDNSGGYTISGWSSAQDGAGHNIEIFNGPTDSGCYLFYQVSPDSGYMAAFTAVTYTHCGGPDAAKRIMAIKKVSPQVSPRII